MLKIAFADDERHARERFCSLADGYQEIELCGLFEEGDSLRRFMESHPLDAVFLDIEMPGENGLELAESLLAKYPNLTVVFVTAYHQYAVDAFDLNAVDYLLKPVSAERFAKTIERLLKAKAKPPVPTGSLYIRCFSRFECLKDGKTLPFAGGKTKELLAYLVERRGVPTSWDQVADAIWGENDFEKAHNVLHITVYRLRKWLAENGISQILECRRNDYRLITGMFQCDLYEFEQAQKTRDFAKMKKLYTGDYLEENGYDWAMEKQAAISILMMKIE